MRQRGLHAIPAVSKKDGPVAKDALNFVIKALVAAHEGRNNLLLQLRALPPLCLAVLKVAVLPSAIIRV